MEGNGSSKRVLEKCGFKRFDGRTGPVFVKRNWHMDEEEALTESTIDQLKIAIEGMSLQNKPTIEPVRTDTADDTTPVKRIRLVGYRYHREGS